MQQRAVPHLLGLGQGLIVGLTGQRSQGRWHVDVHAQVGQRGGRTHIKGRVVHHVISGCHVLPKLLLQPEQAEGRRCIGIALHQTAGHTAGGRQGRRTKGRVWQERKRTLVWR